MIPPKNHLAKKECVAVVIKWKHGDATSISLFLCTAQCLQYPVTILHYPEHTKSAKQVTLKANLHMLPWATALLALTSQQCVAWFKGSKQSDIERNNKVPNRRGDKKNIKRLQYNCHRRKQLVLPLVSGQTTLLDPRQLNKKKGNIFLPPTRSFENTFQRVLTSSGAVYILRKFRDPGHPVEKELEHPYLYSKHGCQTAEN